MKKYRKLSLLFVVLIMIILTGCTKNKANIVINISPEIPDGKVTDISPEIPDGKVTDISSGNKIYLEEDMALPEINPDSENIVSMIYNPKGSCEIFSVKANIESQTMEGFYRYQLVKDGNWQLSEIKWTEPTKYPSIVQYSSDGTLYCAITDINDYNAPKSIAKISDEGTIEYLDIPVLSEKNSYGDYPYLISFLVMDNSKFIYSSFSGVYIYDMETGKLISNEDYQSVSMTSGSGNFSFIDAISGNIITMNSETGREMKSLPLSPDIGLIEDRSEDIYSIKLLSSGNNFYVACTEGIFQYSTEETICLVPGYANDLSRPSLSLGNFCLSKDGTFYIMSKDLKYSNYLYRYSINDADVNKNKMNFSVLLYEKDERVNEALCLLANAHPEISISCTFLSEDTNTEDLRKQWEQADIFVCGYEEYCSIKSNGLLEDISGVVNSLSETECLYKNIINAFTEEDGTYVIPTEFSPYIYAGSDELLKATQSLDQLQQYSQNSGQFIWQNISYETLGQITYRLFYPLITNPDASWNLKGLQKLLENLKTTSSIYQPNYWYDSTYWFDNLSFSNYYKNSKALLATSISNADDLMLLLTAVNASGDKYISSGTFEANNLVGVNKKADKELSTEFLGILYGEDAQNTLIGNGIPLRSSSLTAWTELLYPRRSVYDDTGNVLFEGTLIDDASLNNFRDQLYGISTYIGYNKEKCNRMASSIELYLLGHRTAEDTAIEIAETKDSSDKLYSSLQLDGSEELNVLFIGNSLTRVGQIPEQFAQIAGLCGKKVTVNTFTPDGYHLSQHLSDFISKPDKAELLKEADIILFQEYGSYSETTVSSILDIMDMAPKNARFLYLLTDFDTPEVVDRERRLSQIDNLTMIPAGNVHDLLISELYDYEDLHLSNDYHPNLLNGFISAQTVYVTLFGQDLENIKYATFSGTLDTYLKGSSAVDKEAEFYQLQEYILHVFNNN